MAGVIPFAPFYSIADNGGENNKNRRKGLAEDKASAFPAFQRKYISHRGVNLNKTIAGENSLEAIRYAARAGFNCVEFDMHVSADDQFVVMHDATLNRTALNIEGKELNEPVAVAAHTLEDLKSNFVLKASEEKYRTRIPTVEEFLKECRKQLVTPFIEVKPKPFVDNSLRKLLDLANSICGKDNYVITSNNDVNTQLRRLGYRDTICMGILYQASFEEIAALGNSIMAISISRLSADKYHSSIQQCKQMRILTESHADKPADFNRILDEGIDIVSTDILSPDLARGIKTDIDLESHTGWGNFKTNGHVSNQQLALTGAQFIHNNKRFPFCYFGSIHLRIEFSGALNIRIAGQVVEMQSDDMSEQRYQILFYKQSPELEIKALKASLIKELRVQIQSL